MKAIRFICNARNPILKASDVTIRPIGQLSSLPTGAIDMFSQQTLIFD